MNDLTIVDLDTLPVGSRVTDHDGSEWIKSSTDSHCWSFKAGLVVIGVTSRGLSDLGPVREVTS